MAELMPKYLDTSAFAIVNGAVPETTALLNLRWDHIFYTGGVSVGRVISAAAAKFVTPVTLELGGKSPVFIDKDCDIDLVAKRLLFGKSINTGQVCYTLSKIFREKLAHRAHHPCAYVALRIPGLLHSPPFNLSCLPRSS
jgi:acyl-CoA reductase-like NAD-dependent aldehyde dehydrogenase